MKSTPGLSGFNILRKSRVLAPEKSATRPRIAMPNAGNGPVDFKLSKGYVARILVEIKKSSNSDLLNGFEKQLPEYEKSEATFESIYLIVRVTESDSSINNVIALRAKKLAEGRKAPEIVVVDARKKESASKQKRKKRRS
jgi:hypothetical protein